MSPYLGQSKEAAYKLVVSQSTQDLGQLIGTLTTAGGQFLSPAGQGFSGISSPFIAAEVVWELDQIGSIYQDAPENLLLQVQDG